MISSPAASRSPAVREGFHLAQHEPGGGGLRVGRVAVPGKQVLDGGAELGAASSCQRGGTCSMVVLGTPGLAREHHGLARSLLYSLGPMRNQAGSHSGGD